MKLTIHSPLRSYNLLATRIYSKLNSFPSRAASNTALVPFTGLLTTPVPPVVNLGNGIWDFLAMGTRPNYIDTEPLPTTAAKWKYRAIYTLDSQRIGQWSNIAEITVGG
jgi:hypothetical protein